MPLLDQVEFLRRDLASPVKQIWRESDGDVLERGAKLTRLLNERQVNITAVPVRVLKRALSRVIDFIVARHFGISEVATRRTPVREVDLVFGGSKPRRPDSCDHNPNRFPSQFSRVELMATAGACEGPSRLAGLPGAREPRSVSSTGRHELVGDSTGAAT